LSLTTDRTETGIYLRVSESENDLEKKTRPLKSYGIHQATCVVGNMVRVEDDVVYFWYAPIIH